MIFIRLFVPVLLGLATWGGPVLAAEAGDLAVKYMSVVEADGRYRADVLVNFSLSAPVREALNNGVTLTLETRVQLLRSRFLMPDAVEAERVRRYRLSYNALVQQYVVERVSDGEQESFPDLDSALRYAGQTLNLTLVRTAALKRGAEYYVRARAELDLDTLPLPLRMRAYVLPSWWHKTDWYVVYL